MRRLQDIVVSFLACVASLNVFFLDVWQAAAAAAAAVAPVDCHLLWPTRHLKQKNPMYYNQNYLNNIILIIV